MHYLDLGIAIPAEVIGTSALKASDGFTRPAASVVAAVGYGAAFFFLALSLQGIGLAVAWAIGSGAGVALVTLVGWRVFGQRLDRFALAGIALIVAGVLVLQWSSQAGG